MKIFIIFILLLSSTLTMAMSYKVVTPKHIRPGATLITLLHGCTQDWKQIIGLSEIDKYVEEKNLIVLMPEQSQLRNQKQCWNWFLPNSLGFYEAQAIISLIKEYKTIYKTKRNFLYGLSAGSAMGAHLLSEVPELFDGALLHSGYPANGFKFSNTTEFDLPRHMDSFEEYMLKLSYIDQLSLRLLRNEISHEKLRGKKIIIASGVNDQVAKNKLSKMTYAQFIDPISELDSHRMGHMNLHVSQGRYDVYLYEIFDLGHAWSGGNADFDYSSPDTIHMTTESFKIFGI